MRRRLDLRAVDAVAFVSSMAVAECSDQRGDGEARAYGVRVRHQATVGPPVRWAGGFVAPGHGDGVVVVTGRRRDRSDWLISRVLSRMIDGFNSRACVGDVELVYGPGSAALDCDKGPLQKALPNTLCGRLPKVQLRSAALALRGAEFLGELAAVESRRAARNFELQRNKPGCPLDSLGTPSQRGRPGSVQCSDRPRPTRSP